METMNYSRVSNEKISKIMKYIEIELKFVIKTMYCFAKLHFIFK